MSNRRKPRNQSRPAGRSAGRPASRSAGQQSLQQRDLDGIGVPRCECEHSTGRCPAPAQVWVTVPCSEPDCMCDAVDKFVCLACLTTWREAFPDALLAVTAL